LYIFFLADVKYGENKEEDKEIKRKYEEIKRENEKIKNTIEEKEKKEKVEKNKLENIHINSSKGFFFDFNCLFLLWLGRFINAKDIDEKEVILKSIRKIAVNTKKQCIDTLNSFTEILYFLPSNDKSDINIEIGNEILNLLIIFSENLFSYGDKEKCIQFRSKLEECDCFNTLLFLLNIYENISLKVRISIILANFYKFIVIPNEGKIIIDILTNYLKEQSTKKSNEDENNKFMVSVLSTFLNISVEVDENKKVLLEGGIIPLLLPLVNSPDTNVSKKTVVLLSNICHIKSVEDKNLIINCGIFDVFHKKLLKISSFPPQKMILSNYY
jgi:hypothetical protein